MARRRAKVDTNQPEIVQAFRDLGATVLHLHTVGMGAPDLCIGWQGRNLLVEVKDGSLPPSGRKLTEMEQRWHDAWKGHVAIVENVDQAMNLLGHVRVRGTIQ